MCGINGYIGFTDPGNGVSVVQKMNDALKHRGPDALQHWTDNAITLGHARLSIIDLSAAAHQPLHDTSGRYTIVFNGEIYNYAELKQFVDGTKLRTNSDTEILLNLYIQEGAACLQRLRGMFAFAIWDSKQKELFMARDRFGKKPFYYYTINNTFLFSSEIRSLLASSLVPRKLNASVLKEFIRYQSVHTPSTILKDVYMLEPGHYALFKSGTFTQTEYWKLPDYTHLPHVTRWEAKTTIKKLFEDSIKDRLVADVEVGAFLSGGIDSSAVTGVMSEVAKKSISTFTVSFDETEYSESRYAELVSKKFKTNHHEIVLKPEEMLHDLPNALAAMDHPGGDGPNTWIVSKATRSKGIKVVLTGLGGDELFAGYPVFKNALALQKKKLLAYSPSVVRRGVSFLLGAKRESIANNKIREVLNLPGPIWPNFYAVSRSMFTSDVAGSLVLDKNVHNPVWEYATHVYRNHFHKEAIISYISRCEIRTYLQDVLLRDTDQMTMAHALEARAPFLDHRLVEYVLSLPDAEKIPVTPKALFTEAIGDLLPSDIVNRPKMGFTFPWDIWMRNELKTFCEDRINRLAKRELFNSVLLKDLWVRFLKGDTTITWARVWIFIVLEDWLERHNIES